MGCVCPSWPPGSTEPPSRSHRRHTDSSEPDRRPLPGWIHPPCIKAVLSAGLSATTVPFLSFFHEVTESLPMNLIHFCREEQPRNRITHLHSARSLQMLTHRNTPVTARGPPYWHCTTKQDLATMLSKMEPFHYEVIKLPAIMLLTVK